MSTATPAASTPAPEANSPTNTANQAPDQANSASALDRQILEYLRSRGFRSAEQALQQSLEQDSSPTDKDDSSTTAPTTISSEELVKQLAIFTQKPGQPGENALKDSNAVKSELVSSGQPVNIQNLVSSIGPAGAEEILTVDPGDKQEGFRELEAWVEGSLDMYRPEFRPILFPIFCHFYLDLVQGGYKEAAQQFYAEHSSSISPAHSQVLHHLSTLLLPAHVQADDLAQRFRNEKYYIRLSRSGFSLLVGWLTEGVGGEAMGSSDGFTGEKGKRGRAAVMRVVNNHLKFEGESFAGPFSRSVLTIPVSDSPATLGTASNWEENTGLLEALIPQNSGTSKIANPASYNASKGELKLGPAPISEELKAETERTLRQQAAVDPDPGAQYDVHYLRTAPLPGVTAPSLSDLPPLPPNFRSVDVKREVEKVRDARKRIRLEPSLLANANANTPQGSALRARALPSICAYTLHDVGEGVPCVSFSQDTSLMAAGFSESYIRLWNLKGEKLKGLRSDFQASAIRDSSSLKKIREKGGSSTRKLIGHSGPVYSVSFDPIGGSAASPKYLLSSSADATTRLWSLDTMTNVVAYRGHENPVWDVQWSPLGIYFATGSRDKTARLWSTDRGNALRIYAGHLSDVNSVRFHPNSLYLGTVSSDTTARLWDVQRGSCVRVFIGHQNIVSTLAFSPDGRYLATAGEDLAINLWDLGSGRRVKKMTGHTASIYSLTFSAESSMIVSGGADWTVRCWDVKSAGGLPNKMSQNGTLVNGSGEGVNGVHKEHENSPGIETTDLVATFPTKRTPIINVQFTPRNLCLVAGPYMAPEQR
ncbi:TFIID and SAGA subunit [Panus rudis PR-1116 ss-1]|nr:TFIID and SAGA subunit [Panus rudis PR-1116 ss-1]